MNNTLYQRALEILNDPAHLARIAESIRSEYAEVTAFATSPQFTAMCNTLRNKNDYESVDTEECAYFRVDVNNRLGWHSFTDKEIDLFFRLLANNNGPEVEKLDNSTDEDNPFEHEYFVNYGLHVFRMSGQGTFIRISNQKA